MERPSQRAASEASYERALSDVALAARDAYYSVLLADADVEVAANALALARQRLEQVQLFFDVGTAAEFDLLTAQVAVESARPAQIRAVNAVRLAHNELKRETGVPFATGIELADSLSYEPVAIGLDEAVARALEQRGELIAQREIVELSRQAETSSTRNRTRRSRCSSTSAALLLPELWPETRTSPRRRAQRWRSTSRFRRATRPRTDALRRAPTTWRRSSDCTARARRRAQLPTRGVLTPRRA